MAEFKLNTREFLRTADVYAGYTRRDCRTIVNTKAFYIARRAVIETPKADSSKVRAFFNRSTRAIVGKIINARRGKRGAKGLYGDAMVEAQAMMKAARLRSVAFLKSGWIPAIKTLQPLAEKIGSQSTPSTVKQVGQAKGTATPAREGWKAISIIKNLADAKRDKKQSLHKFGGPALQRALDFETASMKSYIERKLKESARKAGINTH